jgi:lysophospholipase L1-like esterase
MLGDSITAGGEWQELFPEILIVNRGIGGDTTKGLLHRLDEVIERQPKAVFILIGINDMGRGISVEDAFSNYQEIIERLKTEDVKVFVQSTILPGGNVSAERHRQVFELNDKLKALCASEEGVSFVDLNKVLSPAGVLDAKYTLDGIHLNGQGYWEWAETIKSTVEQVAGGNG